MNGDADRMHLGVYAAGTGNHVAGWRYPGATKSGEDFAAFRQIAESAERGPLNHSRSPQGRPVIVQAGSSESGQAFAARHAEVLFSVQQDIDAARAFRGGIVSRAGAQGRDARYMKVLPGLMPVLGGTEREARDKLEKLGRFVDDAAAMHIMSDRLGHDMSRYSLDAPIPELPRSKHIHGYSDVHIARARRAGHTLRDLYNLFAAARGHAVACGAPEQIADTMEEWFRSRACDGFVLLPAYFPAGLDEFVDEVVPILQARGLFRTEYEGSTSTLAPRPPGAREPIQCGTYVRYQVSEPAASSAIEIQEYGRSPPVRPPDAFGFQPERGPALSCFPARKVPATSPGRRTAALPSLSSDGHTLHDVSLNGLGPTGHFLLVGLAEGTNEVVRIGRQGGHAIPHGRPTPALTVGGHPNVHHRSVVIRNHIHVRRDASGGSISRLDPRRSSHPLVGGLPYDALSRIGLDRVHVARVPSCGPLSLPLWREERERVREWQGHRDHACPVNVDSLVNVNRQGRSRFGFCSVSPLSV